MIVVYTSTIGEWRGVLDITFRDNVYLSKSDLTKDR